MKNNILRFEKRGKRLADVPKSLRDEVLNLLHCQFAVGHFGDDKTVRRVLDCCWWPAAQKDVEDFVGKQQQNTFMILFENLECLINLSAIKICLMKTNYFKN